MNSIHITCQDDLAYRWSTDNRDFKNMQMVLRAYGFTFTIEAAMQQVAYALGQEVAA